MSMASGSPYLCPKGCGKLTHPTKVDALEVIATQSQADKHAATSSRCTHTGVWSARAGTSDATAGCTAGQGDGYNPGPFPGQLGELTAHKEKPVPYLNLSGVYAVLCVPTDQRYVGSTINLNKRWFNHRDELNRGVSNHRKLQEAWREQGPQAFAWQVLEYVEPDRLVEREQYWMDHFSAGEHGLNVEKYATRSKPLGPTGKRCCPGVRAGVRTKAESLAEMKARVAVMLGSLDL